MQKKICLLNVPSGSLAEDPDVYATPVRCSEYPGKCLERKEPQTYVEPQKALLHLKKGIYALSGHYMADKANENQTLIELKVAGGEKLYPKFYLMH